MQPVFGYIRCSTDEQTQSGLGLLAQRKAITAWAASKRLDLTGIIEDAAQSGADELASRPGGKALLDHVASGPCVVVVSRLDRLWRSTGDACTRMGEFYRQGIILVSINEGVDLSTPTGRFIARQFANIAELERDLIADRTKQAMAVKIARGERVSRTPPYGWAFAPSGRTNAAGEPVMVQVPNDEERATIRIMLALRRRGKRYPEIAATLDARGIRPRKGDTWRAAAVRKIVLSRRRPSTRETPEAGGDTEAPTGSVDDG